MTENNLTITSIQSGNLDTSGVLNDDIHRTSLSSLTGHHVLPDPNYNSTTNSILNVNSSGTVNQQVPIIGSGSTKVTTSSHSGSTLIIKSSNTSSTASMLGSNSLNPQNGSHGLNIENSIQPVKKTSFQITSVTIDSSASNDGGDESGDDLDESHTEDSSDVQSDVSRHTSESRGIGSLQSGGVGPDESFTRNDVFFNPSPASAMSTAPVIPTCSQYGLAIVSSGNDIALSSSAPAVMSSSIPASNIDETTLGQLPTIPEGHVHMQSISTTASNTAPERAEQERDHVHNRFKVVKIESTEPFKKGRWMCMDYFDHTTSSMAPNLTGTNRISVASSSSPASHQSQQPIPQSHPGDMLVHATTNPTVIPQQQQQQPTVTLHSMSPPTHIQQLPQQMIPSQPLSLVGDSSGHQLMQQQLLQQVQMVQQQSTTQSQQELGQQQSGIGNEAHSSSLNGAPPPQSYHHLSQLHHNVNVVSVEYPNQGPPATTLYQTNQPQPQPQQPPQQQYYTTNSVMDGQTGQPTFQQSADSQSHLSNVPNLAQSYNQSILNQGPPQQQQLPPQQLPGQSLPHGAVSVVSMNPQQTGVVTSSSGQVTQSLGHGHGIQMQKTQFVTTSQPQQAASPSHFQPTSQGELSGITQQTMSQIPQQSQQGQGGTYAQQPTQGNMIITGMSSMVQPQHHIQHVQPIQIQVPPSQQSIQQNPAMYGQQTTLHQPMQIPTQQTGLPPQMMGQPSQIQQMMHQQQQLSSPLHPGLMQSTQAQTIPQQLMSMQPTGQQTLISQNTQPGVPQQTMMGQVPQQIQQTAQMGNILTQSHQAQLITQTPSGMMQQTAVGMMQQAPVGMMQTLQQPPTSGYPGQPSNLNTQQMAPPQQAGVQMLQQFPQGAQSMVPQQGQQTQPQLMTSAPQPTMIQQQIGQVMQQSQLPPQQGHAVHQLPPGQVQQAPQPQQQPMGIVTSQQQQQPYPTQTQSGLMTNIQQLQPMVPMHPTPTQVASSNQMGVPSSISLMSGTPSVIHTSSTSTEQMMSHAQQQQPTMNEIPQQLPSVIGIQATSLIPSAGDTSTTGSNLTNQGKEDGAVVANDEGDSSSGTNTVAIDNKIEQAMDLVKSHLMFAVREEVEVLKERIAELMERINHLEYENSVLRSNASPETLAQIQSQSKSTSSNPSTNS